MYGALYQYFNDLKFALLFNKDTINKISNYYQRYQIIKQVSH